MDPLSDSLAFISVMYFPSSENTQGTDYLKYVLP